MVEAALFSQDTRIGPWASPEDGKLRLTVEVPPGITFVHATHVGYRDGLINEALPRPAWLSHGDTVTMTPRMT